MTLILLFVFLQLYASLPVYADLKVSAFQLSNGLRVILAPINHIEATCVLLYHLTGVRDDPPQVRGGSFLYQNLMLGGTEHLDGYERLLFIKRSGSISNRLVNYDYSFFSQIVPDSELNNALWLESERIGSLRLNQDAINNEKSNVYTRNYRLQNSNINFYAMNWIHSKVFEGTIYETPLYGKLEEIKGFDPQEVEKLYTNFKNPSNIILVITGKFDMTEIRRAISQHFAHLPATTSIPRKKYTAINPRTQYTYLNVVNINIQEPFVLYGIRGPSKLSYDHLYFDFLRYYLLDERISKLEKMLNHENNLDATITYSFTDLYEANALVIRISCKNRINLERAKITMNGLLDSLKKGKIDILSSNDIRDTKTLMEIDFLKQMMSLEKRSLFLAESYHFSGDLGAEARQLSRIRTLSAMDISRIGRKYFDKKNRVNINVYPKND